jgi:hypothetical protein
MIPPIWDQGKPLRLGLALAWAHKGKAARRFTPVGFFFGTRIVCSAGALPVRK